MKRSWTDCMRKKGEQLFHAVEEPVVRHSLHYHCGVYKNDGCREPWMAMHVDNDCTVPLIKVLAVAGGVMLVGAAISAAVSSLTGACRKSGCEDC